jgi:amidohydrolase
VEEAFMRTSLREEIQAMKDWLVEIRRTIHAHPELGFEEVETSRLVAEWLGRFGLEITRGVAKTGVVGLLRGKEPGKTVAIRADMDALPMEEPAGCPYGSRIKGVMHACGHDAHTAILLGVARFFASRSDQIRGNIKWLFQPAEEGGGGGRVMTEEGVLDNPKVDAVFGAHVFPTLPIGKVGYNAREGLAATDRFTIRIIGKGGHGAYPHLCKDPILAAGHLLTQLHSIISRDIAPLESGVITVGKISGGTSFNIIPDEVELLGTVRSLIPEVKNELRRRMEQVARGVAETFGVGCKLDYVDGYPALVNDPEMAKLVAEACSEGIGKENVELLKPSMGGEDFAYYLQKIPGAFFRLGIRNEALGIVHPFHSTRFELDEAVLPLGVEMFVRIVGRYLAIDLGGHP